MKNALLLFSLFITLYTYSQKNVYTIDISSLTVDEQVSVLALQGIANRNSPQIIIEPRSKGCFRGGGYKLADINLPHDGMIPLLPETLSKYESIESVWIEYYEQTYGLHFQRLNFTDLFNHFSTIYNGIIIYDVSSAISGIPLATTIAGAKDAIPVTSTLLAKYPFLKKDTLENLVSRNFITKYNAQKWLVDNYLTNSNKDMAYSYWNKENNLFTIDMAVSRKLFCFDLGYTSPTIHTSSSGANLAYDSAESALLDSVFSHLNPGSIILGWGSSDEYIIQARCGSGGHALICTNASPNFSFHASVPTTESNFSQKRQLTSNDVSLDNKIYITFSINEGDTYKSVGNLMQDGAWLHQKRGQVPFNWPINPKLLQLLPSLAKYYYSTMSSKDYFYSPTSGIGYFDASFSTPAMRSIYAQKGKEAANYCDMHYMDVWWNKFDGREQWIKDMGMSGFTTWTTMQRADFTKVIPYIESDMYYNTNLKTTGMAQYIQEQTKNVLGRPWFVHVYALDPTFAATVMSKLDTTRFKAVGMDEFFLLATKAKTKLLGRYIAKNQTLYDQLVIANQDERFVDEFDYQTLWDNKFCNYSVDNGELTIETIGDNYYSLLVKGNTKFNLDKYPFVATKINQFPLKNVPWKLKMSDGINSFSLPGQMAYQVPGYPSIYCWHIPTITGWTGTKTSNLQLVLEGSNNSQLVGNSMKYDWVRTYASNEQLLSDLANTSIEQKSELPFTVLRQLDCIQIQGSEDNSSLKIYTLDGVLIRSETSNLISIHNFKRGFYILVVNNLYSIKILI